MAARRQGACTVDPQVGRARDGLLPTAVAASVAVLAVVTSGVDVDPTTKVPVAAVIDELAGAAAEGPSVIVTVGPGALSVVVPIEAVR